MSHEHANEERRHDDRAPGHKPAAQRQPVPQRAHDAKHLDRALQGGAEMDTRYSHTDPLLSVGSQLVDFGSVPVGDTRLLKVLVRNDDQRRLTLDDVVPLYRDPFADLVAEYGSSVVLEPGETREVTLRFRPSRTTRSEQVFQFVTGVGPVGPESEVRVVGEGVESHAGDTAARVLKHRDDAKVADAERVVDPVRGMRVQALGAVDGWARQAKRVNQSVADWTRQNWETFLGKTGGDYNVAAPERVLDFWKKGTAKALGTMVKTAIEAAGESEVPGLGFVIDEAIDKVSEFLVDKFAGGPESPPAGDHELAATQSVARDSVAKGEDIIRYRNHADLVIEDSETTAQALIQQARTGEELQRWMDWAVEQRVHLPHVMALSDRSLCEQLLAEWVLQRAKTPTQPNAITNPRAWKEARDELKKSGALPTVARPDLFLHQCAHEWSALGLANVEGALAVLRGRWDKLFNLYAEAGGEPDAATIARDLDQVSVEFHASLDPRRTAAALGSHQYQLSGDSGARVFSRSFDMICWVSLKSDGSAVFVKEFEYRVDAEDAEYGEHDHYGRLYRAPGGAA